MSVHTEPITDREQVDIHQKLDIHILLRTAKPFAVVQTPCTAQQSELNEIGNIQVFKLDS